MKIDVKINDENLKEAVRKSPIKVVYGMDRALTRAGVLAQGFLRKEAPVGVTGRLRSEIVVANVSKTGVVRKVEVGSTSSYNEAVVKGTKPHYVSVKKGKPLRRWADSKGINPYALQKSIARKGTKKNNYVGRVFKEKKSAIVNEFERTFSNEIKEIL